MMNAISAEFALRTVYVEDNNPCGTCLRCAGIRVNTCGMAINPLTGERVERRRRQKVLTKPKNRHATNQRYHAGCVAAAKSAKRNECKQARLEGIVKARPGVARNVPQNEDCLL